mmetsp:Transcript_51435/g.85312  ORF Transcript_51435/g.85312 Transcript_51435/m.85312 type:complete len:242 (+) Transcript_51435:227-952(+)
MRSAACGLISATSSPSRALHMPGLRGQTSSTSRSRAGRCSRSTVRTYTSRPSRAAARGRSAAALRSSAAQRTWFTSGSIERSPEATMSSTRCGARGTTSRSWCFVRTRSLWSCKSKTLCSISLEAPGSAWDCRTTTPNITARATTATAHTAAGGGYAAPGRTLRRLKCAAARGCAASRPRRTRDIRSLTVRWTLGVRPADRGSCVAATRPWTSASSSAPPAPSVTISRIRAPTARGTERAI